MSLNFLKAQLEYKMQQCDMAYSTIANIFAMYYRTIIETNKLSIFHGIIFLYEIV